MASNGRAATHADNPLTNFDKELIFCAATPGLVKRYGQQFITGMTDDELRQALVECLGIFGGSGGPGRPSISYQGSGLKIWGAWSVVNHVQEVPLFAGDATVAMARHVYDIKDPEDQQLRLL